MTGVLMFIDGQWFVRWNDGRWEKATKNGWVRHEHL